MFTRPGVRVRLTIELLEPRNLPSAAALAPNVWRPTTDATESDQSASAIVWTAQTNSAAPGGTSSTASSPTSPASAGPTADDTGETQTSNMVAAPQPSASATTPRTDDGWEAASSATTTQQSGAGNTAGSGSTTSSDDSEDRQTPVSPTAPSSDPGSPSGAPSGPTASNGPAGSSAAPASSPPAQPEASPTSVATPAPAAASGNPASDANSDLKAPSPTSAHAPTPPVSTTESDPDQNDRTAATPPVSSNAIASVESVNSGMTVVGAKGPDGGRVFQAGGSVEQETEIVAGAPGSTAGDAGDGPAPRSAIADFERLAGAAPAAAGLLTEALRFDSAALEAPLRDFLARLNKVGTVLGASPTSVGLFYGLLSTAAVAAAAAAGGAWVLVRRRKDAGGNDPAGANFGDPAFPWMPAGDDNSVETQS